MLHFREETFPSFQTSLLLRIHTTSHWYKFGFIHISFEFVVVVCRIRSSASCSGSVVGIVETTRNLEFLVVGVQVAVGIGSEM